MRSKIYSLGIGIALSLAAFNISAAQNTEPVAPAVPPAPPAAVAPMEPVSAISSRSQDTGYTSKMRQLQEKMRALSKEISELARQQSQKVSAAIRERNATIRQEHVLRFDKDFNQKITAAFSHATQFVKDEEATLQKQVAGGEAKEKSKVFSKSYPVNANDKLQIDNRYGKITVNTWAKNEIKVDVDIKAYSLTDEEAQKLLDETSILAKKDDEGISFSTTIQQGKGTSWGSSLINGKYTRLRKVIINYTVSMPAKNPLIINNRYGLVTLPSLEGKVIINSAYGGLNAKALTNNENQINIKYGDVNVNTLSAGDLNIGYGTLDIESVERLRGNISYTTVKIGKINNSADINLKYGNGLAINELGKQLKTLNINSTYAPVKIGSTTNTNADFDVTVNNTDFIHNNNTIIVSQTPDNERRRVSVKTYNGHLGKGSSDKVIKINARYGGGVKFD